MSKAPYDNKNETRRKNILKSFCLAQNLSSSSFERLKEVVSELQKERYSSKVQENCNAPIALSKTANCATLAYVTCAILIYEVCFTAVVEDCHHIYVAMELARGTTS